MALLDHTEPVARTPHRCTECGGTIAAGDRYARQANVSADGFGTYKAHHLCWSLIDWELTGGETSIEGAEDNLREFWRGLVAATDGAPC